MLPGVRRSAYPGCDRTSSRNCSGTLVQRYIGRDVSTSPPLPGPSTPQLCPLLPRRETKSTPLLARPVSLFTLSQSGSALAKLKTHLTKKGRVAQKLLPGRTQNTKTTPSHLPARSAAGGKLRGRFLSCHKFAERIQRDPTVKKHTLGAPRQSQANCCNCKTSAQLNEEFPQPIHLSFHMYRKELLDTKCWINSAAQAASDFKAIE